MDIRQVTETIAMIEEQKKLVSILLVAFLP